MVFKVAAKWRDVPVRDFLMTGQGMSRRLISALKRDGEININGEPVHVNRLLNEGDTVEIILPQAKAGVELQSSPLDILFEDEFFIAVNKPASMPCHPSMGHKNGTLANFVAGYFYESGIKDTVRMPARIDANTTGIVLVSKNKYVNGQLLNTLSLAKTEKIYMAAVCGKLPEKGVIDAPIGRSDGSIIQREVRPDGQKAVTLYERIRVCKNIFSDCPKEYSLAKVKIETGRTHQIRVHMSHIGHPLLGDWLYGIETKEFARHMLHLRSISFEHPITGEKIKITAPYPEDMSRLFLEE
ncbi:MAG: RluA family pseudouridine synthase [Bacillota bacterium]|nr:RluA family pseudouridine synthase [Bacillota bacterium]